MERRNYNTELELRNADGKSVIRGYAAVFNVESEDLGGFTEIVAPGFFDNVLNDDVRALKNHQPDYILGRTTSGTLRIGIDERGLWYEYDDPATTYSTDLSKSIQRKDINQSSFGFTVSKDQWKQIDGRTVRTLIKAGRLIDVSPVTFPAYPDTTVAKRSLQEFKSDSPVNDLYLMDQEIMKLQMQ